MPVLTAGPTWVNFVHATNAANHYATPPTSVLNGLFGDMSVPSQRR